MICGSTGNAPGRSGEEGWGISPRVGAAPGWEPPQGLPRGSELTGANPTHRAREAPSPGTERSCGTGHQPGCETAQGPELHHASEPSRGPELPLGSEPPQGFGSAPVSPPIGGAEPGPTIAPLALSRSAPVPIPVPLAAAAPRVTASSRFCAPPRPSSSRAQPSRAELFGAAPGAGLRAGDTSPGWQRMSLRR